MKKYIILLASLFHVFSSTYALSVERSRVAVSSITFGPEAENKISTNKVEAAFNLLSVLSEKYAYIDQYETHSIINDLRDSVKTPSNDQIMQALNLSRVYSLHINILANMLSVYVSYQDVATGAKSGGMGYASIKYYKVADNTALYDPALLRAMQRAFAVAEKDSLLFTHNDSAFYAYPAPTVVISGIEFIDDKSLINWGLFDNQEVSSYFIIESAFDTLKYEENLVLYDTETRDSLYYFYGLSIPENHKAASNDEFYCLSKHEVNYVISGSFSRIEEGAKLIFTLSEVKGDTITFISKVEEVINEDSKVLLSQTAKSLANKLITDNQEVYYKRKRKVNVSPKN